MRFLLVAFWLYTAWFPGTNRVEVVVPPGCREPVAGDVLIANGEEFEVVQPEGWLSSGHFSILLDRQTGFFGVYDIEQIEAGPDPSPGYRPGTSGEPCTKEKRTVARHLRYLPQVVSQAP